MTTNSAATALDIMASAMTSEPFPVPAPTVLCNIPLITFVVNRTDEVSVTMEPYYTVSGSFTLHVHIEAPESVRAIEPFMVAIVLNTIRRDEEFAHSSFASFVTFDHKYVIASNALCRKCAEAIVAAARTGVKMRMYRAAVQL